MLRLSSVILVACLHHSSRGAASFTEREEEYRADTPLEAIIEGTLP